MKIKNILRIYILLYFALFAWEAQASSETENVELITYPENAFSKIEKVIRQARKSIDIYAYHLKHLKVVDLLIQKKRENVSIRVIAEHDQYKHAFNKESSTEAYSKLANAGIPIHQKPKYYRKNHPTGHFHAKFILVDNETLLLTSGGFDGMTFDVCRDLGVILHQKDYSTELREAHNLFLADWVNQPYRNSSDSSRLIIGPEGQKEIFHNFLRSAKKSLHVYQQYLNDEMTLKILANAVKKGIKVQVLMMPFPTSYATDPNFEAQNTMAKANVDVRLNTNHYVHTKLIIVDEKEAIIGSASLSKISLDENREISFALSGKIVTELLDFFQKDWNKAHSLDKGRTLALKNKTDWNRTFNS